jgi:hypothetical protein
MEELAKQSASGCFDLGKLAGHAVAGGLAGKASGVARAGAYNAYKQGNKLLQEVYEGFEHSTDYIDLSVALGHALGQ